VLAGPSTGDEFNTIQSAVFPIACFKVENIRFDFDSSVVKPELRNEMPVLAQLLAEHTEPEPRRRPPPVSLFGHADPVGNDESNKKLSGRRAAAIYGLLTRRTEIWEELYGSHADGDVWGTRSIQLMLNALPPDQFGLPAPAEPLKADGQLGPKTRQRVAQFQSGPAGLAGDGEPGPATRKALFLAYMDFICVDAAGAPYKIDPKDGFLGHDLDADGKGDYQGCSEFNPVLLFSRAEKARFDAAKDKTERNLANAENRRVMVLLFRPGAKVSPALWPCPRAKEGTAGCRKRFWSDGEKRRSNGEEERRFDATRDTFACRFYQRMLSGSPCESVLDVFLIRLFDALAVPIPFAPCVVTEPGKSPRADRASGPPPDAPAATTSPAGGAAEAGEGSDEVQGGFITLRNLKVPATVNVKWSRPRRGEGAGSPLPKLTDEFEFELDVAIEIPEDESDGTSLIRLRNLGYTLGPEQVDDIRSFQLDHKERFPDIRSDGTLDPATKTAIREVHDGCDPQPKRCRSVAE
jgi:hypothetical protein